MLSLPGFVLVAMIGAGAFMVGVGLTLLFGQMRRTPLELPDALFSLPEGEGYEPVSAKSAANLALIGGALREPIRALRRAEVPADLVAGLERASWQARMLASRPRPMRAKPTSPIATLQDAAQEVEALRLGKVALSWSLLTRQPVHVDPDRARSGFRELLKGAANAVGEGGRIAIRVHEGARERFPVRVEIEIGRRGAEPEVLPYRVARHLLEEHGAEVALDGPTVRVDLPSTAPDPD